MAQSIIDVLPKIRSLAKRYAGPCASAEDLESVGVLAVMERGGEWDERGSWEAFAFRIAQNGIRDEVRRLVRQTSHHVLYDALSTTATMCMLAKGSTLGNTKPFQDENAYVSEIMSRLQVNALGKQLFSESLNGKVSCMDIARRRRRAKSRWAHARALKDAKMRAAELVSDD